MIKLYNIPSSIVSYTLIHNDIIYISSKLKSDQEILIKIPSSNISTIKLLSLSQDQDEKENDKAAECDIILDLNEQCQLFEYYHRHKLWICTGCGSVNNAENKNTLNTIPNQQEKMKCVCCHAELADNNDYHLHDLNNILCGLV